MELGAGACVGAFGFAKDGGGRRLLASWVPGRAHLMRMKFSRRPRDAGPASVLWWNFARQALARRVSRTEQEGIERSEGPV